MKKTILIIVILIVLSFLPLFKKASPNSTCLDDSGNRTSCYGGVSLWNYVGIVIK